MVVPAVFLPLVTKVDFSELRCDFDGQFRAECLEKRQDQK